MKLPFAFPAARPVTFKVVICRFAAAFTVMSPLTFEIVTVMLPSAGSTLTALKETTNNKDLFAGAKTFNWKEKSYELKYTPTTSDVTLEAVFTPSHIVHVHVTGGTAEVKDTGLVTKESGADQFQHVIVKDNETVELEL